MGASKILIWGLNLVFNELYENELDARAFIVKPNEIQKMDVITILQKNHSVADIGTLVGEESVNMATNDVSSGMTQSSFLCVAFLGF